MANPFLSKFDSSCPQCGSPVWEGESMYACGPGVFMCGDCAHEQGYVCKCGGFKKEEYETCFECSGRSSSFLPKAPNMGKYVSKKKPLSSSPATPISPDDPF